MTREELLLLFGQHIEWNKDSNNVVIGDISILMNNIIELHEEKLKQLAIYLNK